MLQAAAFARFALPMAALFQRFVRRFARLFLHIFLRFLSASPLLAAGWTQSLWWLRRMRRPGGFRIKPRAPSARCGIPKPAWVRHEVLRLAALTGAGCRTIEKLFNRLHAVRGKMSVGRSYVSYTVRKYRYEIGVLRRDVKHRPPRPIPTNDTRAIDMTGKGDVVGDVHSILGIEGHGSRRLLALDVLERRNTWTLLGHVFLAIGRFGAPRALRSDNEAVFRSFVFRAIVWLAGIGQQFSVPGCPWMNGRIERLFGTLKAKLDRIEVDSRAALARLLAGFRFWYNAVRPHQNLAGLTPLEAWRGIDPYAGTPKSAHRFEAWDGLLKGYYLRR